MKKSETIYVGLSGGVDSAVAAKRLIDEGYDVVGVFIKVWHPEFLVCDWESERLDAMRVAAHLNIPFLTFDAVEAYKTHVADYMIAEYAKGRTPNPDVMCNTHVKFGVFLTWALAQGADAVATGHYARILWKDGTPRLFRGIDVEKDQSYFLWSLTDTELEHTRFPVGDTRKADIRKEAERAGLPVFDKRDSQGICFLGQIDMQEFLSHYISTTSGIVLHTDGTPIGTHDGALLYTLGERHGFTLTNPKIAAVPHYVVAKNLSANTITVADSPQKLTIGAETIALSGVVMRGSIESPQQEAQFRYRQRPFKVLLKSVTSEYAMLTVLDDTVEMPSPGQSCVIYNGAECLGGGIVEVMTSK